MSTSALPPVDPVLSEVIKAIYGDVDEREILAKFSPGGSDLHMDGPVDPKKQAEREKKLAVIGMGSTAVAAAGGVHALKATHTEHLQRMANAGDTKAKAKLVASEAKAAAKTTARAERTANMKGPAGKVLRVVAAHPKQAALAAGAGFAGLHGVELAGDALAMRAQTKAYGDAQRKQNDVSKAFRLKLLNPGAPKLPSLRARRPAANPLPKTPTAQGALYKPVTKAFGWKRGPKTRGALFDAKQTGFNANAAAANTNVAAKHAAEIAGKFKALKPTAAQAIMGTGAVLGGALAASALGGTAGRRLGEVGDHSGKAKKLVARQRRRVEAADADVAKGWLRGARATFSATEKATDHAYQASHQAAEAARKLNEMVPDKATATKTMRRLAIGGAATIGGSSAAGSYAAARRDQARGPKYVMVKKSLAMSALETGANYIATSPIWRVRGTINNAERTKKAAKGAAKAPGAIRGAAESAEQNLRTAAENTKKFNENIPDKRKVKRAAAVTAGIGLGTGGTLAGGASFAANRRGREQIVVVPVKKPKNVAKARDVTWTGEIAKVDADKRQVFGWASVSEIGGQAVVDLQGDIVPIDEIEKSAYRYVLESRKGGDMHRRVAKSADAPMHTADLIESFVVTPEKLAGMGLPGDALPHGWWVGFKVNDDEQWNLVKSGHRKGFSIHGKGVRVPHEAISKSASGVDADSAVSKRITLRHVYEPSWWGAGPSEKNLVVSAREKVKGRLRVRTLGNATITPEHSIESIEVQPGRRREGIATAMVDHAEKVTGKRVTHSAQRSTEGNAFAHAHEARRGGKPPQREYLSDPLAKADTISKGIKNYGPVVRGVRPARAGTARANLRESKQAVAAARIREQQRRYGVHDDQGRFLGYPLSKSDDDMDLKGRARKVVRRSLGERFRQAVHPPAVKLQPVKSTAVSEMGYQGQTRRLTYKMRSGDRTYTYKVAPEAGRSAVDADSKGRYYAREVRGKAERSNRVGPLDRARLFLDPVEKAEKKDRTTEGLAAGSAASGAAGVGLGVKAQRKYRLAEKQHYNAARRLGYAAQTIAGGANAIDRRPPGPPTVIPNKKAMRTLDRMISDGNGEHWRAAETFREGRSLGRRGAAAAAVSAALGGAALAHKDPVKKAAPAATPAAGKAAPAPRGPVATSPVPSGPKAAAPAAAAPKAAPAKVATLKPVAPAAPPGVKPLPKPVGAA